MRDLESKWRNKVRKFPYHMNLMNSNEIMQVFQRIISKLEIQSNGKIPVLSFANE